MVKTMNFLFLLSYLMVILFSQIEAEYKVIFALFVVAGHYLGFCLGYNWHKDNLYK